jgi:hypothetical protein
MCVQNIGFPLFPALTYVALTKPKDAVNELWCSDGTAVNKTLFEALPTYPAYQCVKNIIVAKLFSYRTCRTLTVVPLDTKAAYFHCQ